MKIAIPILCLVLSSATSAQSTGRLPIESAAKLTLINVSASPANYRNRQALRVIQSATPNRRDVNDAMVRLTDVTFTTGTIEIDVAGTLGPNAVPDDRGFIGLGFHAQPNESRYKVFYIRPTNGRANDQLRRNHVTQYVAAPEWTWQRLRSEEPGVYESYADVVAGEWTHLKIVVSDKVAHLYVNGATQPTLIVNNMKVADADGGIVLWIGRGTEGYFSNLTISK